MAEFVLRRLLSAIPVLLLVTLIAASIMQLVPGDPAMVIAGLRDQSTPVSAMKDMAATIPGADYRELDTGHLAPLEQPGEFAALLRGFANRVHVN